MEWPQGFFMMDKSREDFALRSDLPCPRRQGRRNAAGDNAENTPVFSMAFSPDPLLRESLAVGGVFDGPQNLPNRQLRSTVSKNHGHFTGLHDPPAGIMQKPEQKRFSMPSPLAPPGGASHSTQDFR